MIYEWWVFIFFSSMVIHTFICGTQMTRLTPISGAPRNHAGDIPTFHLEWGATGSRQMWMINWVIEFELPNAN
jgi:hypothetical protein